MTEMEQTRQHVMARNEERLKAHYENDLLLGNNIMSSDYIGRNHS